LKLIRMSSITGGIGTRRIKRMTTAARGTVRWECRPAELSMDRVDIFSY
jgi:hypothetical protein